MTLLKTRLLGLGATLLLIAFVAGTPALLLAITAAPNTNDLAWPTLTSPDDGTLALTVIAVVAWIAWAIFTVSVALALAARVTRSPARRVPGLYIPQLAANRLVAIAALLFVATPTHAAAGTDATHTSFAEPVAVAAKTFSAPRSHKPPPPTPPPVAAHRTATAAQPTQEYTVKRGDSLWKIAEQHLGDGTRYIELENLNRDVLDGVPDFLIPGTILRLPTEQPTRQASSYEVQPGDTLSEIAETKLGNAADYPEIVEASHTTIQPGGAHLTDPDLIRPGWHLTIPDSSSSAQPHHRNHADHHTEVATTPRIEERAKTEPTAPTPQTSHHSIAGHEEDLPSWVLPGLAGGGAALAGAMLLVLRQHRRTQLRFRRPGCAISPPPPELLAMEKSTAASGSVTAPRVEKLEQALRNLITSHQVRPRLATARLRHDSVEVTLTEQVDLREPWRRTESGWAIQFEDLDGEELEISAPYPLTVSIGIDENDALVYINLEELRTVALTGNQEAAEALARHIAAELALNPWSSLVEVHAVAIASELSDLDPLRLRYYPVTDAQFLTRLAHTLEDEDPNLEPDQYRAIIAGSLLADHAALEEVAAVVTSFGGRPGAAVITVSPFAAAVETVEVRLSQSRRLQIRSLGLDLTSADLSSSEATACAALVDITRESTSVPMPAGDHGANTDAAGALRPELTIPRPNQEMADAKSLLPEPTATYEEAAAIVREDLDTLAPLATPGAAKRIAKEDPHLDEDLANWQASTLVRPKLTLLGPVHARTLGDPRQMARRRPFYVELLAYLALHPKGVTADEVAESMGLRAERARKDLGIVRSWLGTDPQTGRLHLPNARQTHTEGIHATYAVTGVLTDLDLFRRLRARGQSIGADGINDLQTALSLVSGEPFTDLRPAGWGWLLEGDRIDHVMTCSIVDTAHMVTTRALSGGDLEMARFAAQTACRAAPFDETSRLDLAAVYEVEGRDQETIDLVINGVLNRSDDDLGPTELPARTTEISQRRGWNHAPCNLSSRRATDRGASSQTD